MIDQPQGEKPAPAGEKPALTVVIQSWWTPALAVIMLVIGLLVGYLGRPLLNNNSASNGKAVALVTQVGAVPTGLAANPTATIDPTQDAINRQTMMDNIIKQTTNFQGDPNATVTLIEFSDYQ